MRGNLRRHAALIAVVAAALALRLYGLAPFPDIINQDEVVNGLDALCLAHAGVDHLGNPFPLLFESFGDWVSPLLTYLTVPFVALAGFSQTSVRLPVVLANTAGVVLVYALVTEVWASRRAAIVAAAVFAFSVWEIAVSQFAAAPSIVPPLVAATLLVAVRSARTSRGIDAAWFAVFAASLVYAYPVMKAFAPVLALALLFALRTWRARAIVAAGFVLVSLPIFWLDAFGGPQYHARLVFVRLDPNTPNYPLEVLWRYVEYLSPRFYFANFDLEYSRFHGDMSFPRVLELFVYFGAALAAIAIARRGGVAGMSRRSGWILTSAALAVPIGSSVMHDHYYTGRMIAVLPLVAAYAGIGLDALIWGIASRTVARLCAVAVVVLFALQSAHALAAYLNGGLQRAYVAQVGLGAGFRILAARYPTQPVIVVDAWNQPSVYYLAYAVREPWAIDFNAFRSQGRVGNVTFRPVPQFIFHIAPVLQPVTIPGGPTVFVIHEYERQIIVSAP